MHLVQKRHCTTLPCSVFSTANPNELLLCYEPLCDVYFLVVEKSLFRLEASTLTISQVHTFSLSNATAISCNHPFVAVAHAFHSVSIFQIPTASTCSLFLQLPHFSSSCVNSLSFSSDGLLLVGGSNGSFSIMNVALNSECHVLSTFVIPNAQPQAVYLLDHDTVFFVSESFDFFKYSVCNKHLESIMNFQSKLIDYFIYNDFFYGCTRDSFFIIKIKGNCPNQIIEKSFINCEFHCHSLVFCSNSFVFLLSTDGYLHLVSVSQDFDLSFEDQCDFSLLSIINPHRCPDQLKVDQYLSSLPSKCANNIILLSSSTLYFLNYNFIGPRCEYNFDNLSLSCQNIDGQSQNFDNFISDLCWKIREPLSSFPSRVDYDEVLCDCLSTILNYSDQLSFIHHSWLLNSIITLIGNLIGVNTPFAHSLFDLISSVFESYQFECGHFTRRNIIHFLTLVDFSKIKQTQSGFIKLVESLLVLLSESHTKISPADATLGCNLILKVSNFSSFLKKLPLLVNNFFDLHIFASTGTISSSLSVISLFQLIKHANCGNSLFKIIESLLLQSFKYDLKPETCLSFLVKSTLLSDNFQEKSLDFLIQELPRCTCIYSVYCYSNNQPTELLWTSVEKWYHFGCFYCNLLLFGIIEDVGIGFEDKESFVSNLIYQIFLKTVDFNSTIQIYNDSFTSILKKISSLSCDSLLLSIFSKITGIRPQECFENFVLRLLKVPYLSLIHFSKILKHATGFLSPVSLIEHSCSCLNHFLIKSSKSSNSEPNFDPLLKTKLPQVDCDFYSEIFPILSSAINSLDQQFITDNNSNLVIKPLIDQFIKLLHSLPFLALIDTDYFSGFVETLANFLVGFLMEQVRNHCLSSNADCALFQLITKLVSLHHSTAGSRRSLLPKTRQLHSLFSELELNTIVSAFASKSASFGGCLGSLVILIKECPLVLPYSFRIKLMKQLINFYNGNSESKKLVFEVDREDPINSFKASFDANSLIDIRNCNLRISFTNEVGIDVKGLRQECFSLVSRQLFFELNDNMVEYGDFTIPNVKSCNSFQKFIGFLLAQSFLNDLTLNCNLHPLCWKILLGQTVSLFELLQYDVFLRNSVDSILACPASMGLFFTSFDGKELVPSGSFQPVTDLNKWSFVTKLLEFELNKLKASMVVVKQTFRCFVSPQVLKLISSEELSSAICGLSVIDVEVLKGVTKIKGTDADNDTVKFFWKELESSSQDRLQQFVEFVTSSPRVSPNLLYQDQPYLTVHVTPKSTRLPSASTCFSLLKLPDYGDQDLLQTKLWSAIESDRSFSFD
ncbi:hypothetical protein P9112_009008 [Eukaryota sp. TZLM1-RC]